MSIRLSLAGDVMTGRGIDQILPHPADPTLYEGWVKNAVEYVELAERAGQPIPQPVEPGYIWGDALEFLHGHDVDARIINLETALTDRGDPWPHKGIHYRMSPKNIDCITIAGIDVCTLANNHVLDWSRQGLEDTVTTLQRAGIGLTGAGSDAESAWKPATVDVPPARLVVLGIGMGSSGIPRDWEAGPSTPGVAYASGNLEATLDSVCQSIESIGREGDIPVVSIHWGPNWGYGIPAQHRRLAHALVDAGVSLIHGHSSHHPMGIEIYRERPIFYGCGDLINDYEGIGGHDAYLPDLRALYLLDLENDGRLAGLELVPMRSKQFRLTRVSEEDADHLARTLNEHAGGMGGHFETNPDRTLRLRR